MQHQQQHVSIQYQHQSRSLDSDAFFLYLGCLASHVILIKASPPSSRLFLELVSNTGLGTSVPIKKIKIKGGSGTSVDSDGVVHVVDAGLKMLLFCSSRKKKLMDWTQLVQLFGQLVRPLGWPVCDQFNP